MKNQFSYDTKIGRIYISADENYILEVSLRPLDGIEKENFLIKKAYEQLAEYMDGKRKFFDVPIKFDGTDFQKKVWHALCEIPYGETRSYKDIAKTVGNEKACRAVGMANNKNHIMIIIPCHRVVGSNGDLTGYAGGLKLKKKLLELEKSC